MKHGGKSTSNIVPHSRNAKGSEAVYNVRGEEYYHSVPDDCREIKRRGNGWEYRQDEPHNSSRRRSKKVWERDDIDVRSREQERRRSKQIRTMGDTDVGPNEYQRRRSYEIGRMEDSSIRDPAYDREMVEADIAGGAVAWGAKTYQIRETDLVGAVRATEIDPECQG